MTRMLDVLRSNYQILAVITLVLIILAVKVFGAAGEERRKRADGRRIAQWKRLLDSCAASGSFKLGGRELSWFADSGMLEAYGFLQENGMQEECFRVLAENSGKISAVCASRADSMEKAYFAFILSSADLSAADDSVREEYTKLVLGLMRSSSVHCRENALKALYNLGDAKAVASAISTLSEDARPHNEKLLADGMNSFRGDRRALAQALMDRFESYDDKSQSSVISYFAVCGYHDRDDYFRRRFKDADISVDQRCDILRLLTKDPCEENRRMLIDELLTKYRDESWQTAAVSAAGLGSFEYGDDISEALCTAIRSPFWDVRMNCASSLVRLKAPASVTESILNGGDRFAADAMRYAIDRKRQGEL